MALESKTPLTVIEKKNLAELERKLEDLKKVAEKTFYEMGCALAEIRDNRYYRETHDTFEHYCQERWGFERNYANKIIRSSEVVDNLGTTVPKNISERAVRPLTKLPAERQKEVFQTAIETAPNGKLTGRHVETTIEQMNQSGQEFLSKFTVEHTEAQERASNAMAYVDFALVQLESINDDDPLALDALMKVMNWIVTRARKIDELQKKKRRQR